MKIITFEGHANKGNDAEFYFTSIITLQLILNKKKIPLTKKSFYQRVWLKGINAEGFQPTVELVICQLTVTMLIEKKTTLGYIIGV